MSETVRLKIISAWPMGVSQRHEGQVFDAVRIDHGYGLIAKHVSHYRIDDRWVRAGHAVLVEDEPDEIDFGLMIP